MNHTRRITAWAAAAAAVLLVGCSSTVKLDEAPVVNRDVTGAGSGTATGTGTGGAAVPGGAGETTVKSVDLTKTTAANAAAATGRVVYFDFDSFVVRDEFRSLIDAHARTLASNKAKRMLIEGHTDERGGREYNLALGQKRAEAVAKSMALLGAGQAQVEAVSFGKERPAMEGHDEAAWAKNRRAELKDR
jgi:peptidoglycan-associated lipoprotein